MRRITGMLITLLLLCPAIAWAQTGWVVQVTTETNSNGKCINWVEQPVTWGTEDLTEDQVPDHVPITADATQNWYAQINPATNTWRQFSFTRNIKGVYFLRYTLNLATGLFSVPTAVVISPPGQARHN